MKYYKITYFYRGEQNDVFVKENSISEAISFLKNKNKNIEIIDIEEVPIPLEDKIKIFLNLIKEKIFIKKINIRAYSAALDQIAILINAGISIKDALLEVAHNSKGKLVKEIFTKAAETVEKGGTLSTVMAEYEVYLGNISYAMVKLGEKTGNMDTVLRKLAEIYEKMDENRKKVKKAMRYPLITLTAIVGAFIFLVTVVVPKFKGVFEQLHAKLPLPTLLLLFLEKTFREYGLYVLLGFIAIIMSLIYFYKTDKVFKYNVDNFLLKVYLINKIIYLGTLSRFISMFNSLIDSGLSVIESLQIAKGVVNNEIIREKIDYIIVSINQGKNLYQSFKEVNLLDFISLRMVKAGEESGEINKMLEKVAKYYETKVDNLIDNIQAAIEPLVLLVIGALVLLLALGIFLPMWNLALAAKNAG